MRILAFVSLAICFFFSCGNPASEVAESPLRKSLLGEWRNVSLKVNIQNDTAFAFEANEKNWEEIVGIRPIRTFFNNDGTFHSEHYTLEDSLFLDVKGIWKVEGNQLWMIQESPNLDTIICRTTLKGNLVEFDCMVDWDEDGQDDDHYFGVQRKQDK